jgi:hypothetical protein
MVLSVRRTELEIVSSFVAAVSDAVNGKCRPTVPAVLLRCYGHIWYCTCNVDWGSVLSICL